MNLNFWEAAMKELCAFLVFLLIVLGILAFGLLSSCGVQMEEDTTSVRKFDVFIEKKPLPFETKAKFKTKPYHERSVYGQTN
jgi:hypothetical protein